MPSIQPAPKTTRSLWFSRPLTAELRTEQVAPPEPNQVTIRALVSLVSAGTELLVYRGEAPPDADLGLKTCAGSFRFPVKYAYQIVGEICSAGRESGYQIGELVFARHPHQAFFTMTPDSYYVTRIPASLSAERAAFINLLEVALNCLMDTPVHYGDKVAIHGQGIIGLFLTQLVRRTAGAVIVVDPVESRQSLARDFGADLAVTAEDAGTAITEFTKGAGVDLSIEVSGAPQALQTAIETTAESGTIAAVSFYGNNKVPLVLAPEFHFRRLRLVSAMVGDINGCLRPRWTVERRTQVAMDLLSGDWLANPPVTRLEFGRAPEAYDMLHKHREETFGVLLDYR
jgi:threonine dehydrogenase-like Zn-dependent dehydrogenase